MRQASGGDKNLGGSLVTRARLSRRPLDCALRKGFHILIMLSVCQFGMAAETGKEADAAFDAGVVVLLKQ